MRAPVFFAVIAASCVAGLTAASVVTGSTAQPPPSDTAYHARTGSDRLITRARDPKGGPDWAVRSYEGITGLRCLAVGRLDTQRFGRVDARGQIDETGVDDSGSCADSGPPSQLEVSRQPQTPGAPASSVQFGTVDRSRVETLTVTDPSGSVSRIDGAAGAVLVVREETSSTAGAWQIVLTLRDGRSELVRL